jgi:hypothetical protein
MAGPAISLNRLLYDDSAWRVFIWASNGEFTGALEFYTHDEPLGEFACRLLEFPDGRGNEAKFVIGSREGNWAYYVLMRAFLIDRAGHAALEFAVDDRRAHPHPAEARLFIPCEVEAVKRLGRQLRSWIERSDESLTWTVANV